jgi:8-oxo-dGTP diphosphatase
MDQKLIQVCGFAVSRYERKIALINKLKPEWMKGHWNGVGGKVKEGEGEFAAMVREFYEETGLMTEEEDWRHRLTYLHGNPPHKPNETVTVHYFVTDLGTSVNLVDQMEEEEVCIFTFENNWSQPDRTGILCPLVPNLYWIIPLVMDMTIDGPILVGARGDIMNPRQGIETGGWLPDE